MQCHEMFLADTSYLSNHFRSINSYFTIGDVITIIFLPIARYGFCRHRYYNDYNDTFHCEYV